MEYLIPLVTVLFILSIIFERIVEFLKNYLSGKKFLNRWLWVGDTTTKYPIDSPQELRRHYRILKLNLTVGFLTAALCHANLFTLLSANNPAQVIGWNSLKYPLFSPDWFAHLKFDITYLPKNIYSLFGCLLTGAFISLGSKFWHDLLDILLLAKDVRRSAIAATSANLSFAGLSEDEQAAKISAAIKMYSDQWRNTFPELTGIGMANKRYEAENRNTSQKVIQFHVAKKGLSAVHLPAVVEYFGYKIPTDIVEAGTMELADWKYSGLDDEPRQCGASISRTYPSYKATGTIGLKVARDTGSGVTYYLLTCAHVVMDHEMNSGRVNVEEGMAIEKSEANCPGQMCGIETELIGNVVEAKLNYETDSALVRLSDPNALDNQIHVIGKPRGYYVVTSRDHDVLRVQFTGAASGHVANIIVRGSDLEKNGNYPPSSGVDKIKGLIAIDRCSSSGDSGAIVMDMALNIVGMLIGGDNLYTYVIPIHQIRAKHKNFNCIDIN